MKKKKPRKQKKATDLELDAHRNSVEKIADKLFGNKVHYVTTNIDLAKKLRSLGHVPVCDGILPGLIGALVAEAPLRTTPDVVAFLVPTSTLLPDPDSAVQVLKILHILMPDLGLDKAEQELEKDVASLKKMLQGLLRNLTSDSNLRNLGALRGSRGVPHGMYQ